MMHINGTMSHIYVIQCNHGALTDKLIGMNYAGISMQQHK